MSFADITSAIDTTIVDADAVKGEGDEDDDSVAIGDSQDRIDQNQGDTTSTAQVVVCQTNIHNVKTTQS
ncbi:hypothetical protein PC123_g5809 [Phytophthora cactorum]|nr:hypothetical protein PC120_g19414 [Phytophthora cactorum]KAG4059245.1 hypothetical protein PC123_g5809 [Phytophthora cactorum]